MTTPIADADWERFDAAINQPVWGEPEADVFDSSPRHRFLVRYFSARMEGFVTQAQAQAIIGAPIEQEAWLVWSAHQADLLCGCLAEGLYYPFAYPSAAAIQQAKETAALYDRLRAAHAQHKLESAHAVLDDFRARIDTPLPYRLEDYPSDHTLDLRVSFRPTADLWSAYNRVRELKRQAERHILLLLHFAHVPEHTQPRRLGWPRATIQKRRAEMWDDAIAHWNRAIEGMLARQGVPPSAMTNYEKAMLARRLVDPEELLRHTAVPAESWHLITSHLAESHEQTD